MNLEVKQLGAGDRAPAFSLQNQHGESVSSESFHGSRLLLYFYPRASTPGCTVQACSVRDSLGQFKRLGLRVVAISPDSPDKLKKFDEKQGLGFPLLSDPEMKVASAYGATGEKTMFGKKKFGIIRSSFLLDGKGVIAGAWYKVKPDETVAKALELLATLK